jgi:lipopolysaccharide transport system ATP-binding protein
MSDIVIRAEGLGKKYLIGHQARGGDRYMALRDVIGRTARNLVRSARDMVRGRQLVVGDEIEEFWALKDVNFEIKRGEVVGVIGRNGAGKSTLLKVLSRITEPSIGRVEIKGRVASLLEVGTGFHPELTGRENIYLNGAILGMTRGEIRRKFDEIVDFSGVEQFLDTPVKRYSSGMYVRLAFAIAAHLEPEILVVDEVLAVGDAEFQKKCLGKMQDVAGHGRTVLFVSHNVGAVQSLCTTGLFLVSGAVEARGEISATLDAYQRSQVRASSSAFASTVRPGRPQMTGFSHKQHYASSEGLGSEPHLEFCVSFAGNTQRRNLRLAIGVYDLTGRKLLMLDSEGLLKTSMPCPQEGSFRVKLTSSIALIPGEYRVNLLLSDEHGAVHYLENAALFDVEPFDFFGRGGVPDASAPIQVRHAWQRDPANVSQLAV